jgi:hypothetical protein
VNHLLPGSEWVKVGNAGRGLLAGLVIGSTLCSLNHAEVESAIEPGGVVVPLCSIKTLGS